MQSLSQFFSFMNDVNFPYVVMRNWDGLPETVEVGVHSDLDLLVYDFDHFLELFPTLERQLPDPRVRYKIPIGDEGVYCDVRSIGDGYYPRRFQMDMINYRVPWMQDVETEEGIKQVWKGFYVPSPIHHKIALAYHCVHHKGQINPTYRRWLGDVSLDSLKGSLQKSAIGWVPPKDTTVGSFNKYWVGATSEVEKKDGVVFKTQTGYLDYKLIENEYRILNERPLRRVESHFPKVISHSGNTICLEDCGEHLTPQNLPEDWKRQLFDVLEELEQNDIIHRDIRPDNLMVKGKLIKLIDFGWAMFKKDETEIAKSPPQCLGFPFKPSKGYSDLFSMRQVIKKIEYEKEIYENTRD